MKNSKEKKSNPSKLRSRKSTSKVLRKVHYLDEYRSCFDWRMYPATERFFEALSLDMIKYFESHPKKIRLEEFLRSKGVLYKTYMVWLEKYPQHLKEAYQETMRIISRNREILGAEHNLDSGMMERSLILYDDDEDAPRTAWQLVKAKAALTAKSQAGNSESTFHIYVPAAESSPLVPERKTKK